MKLIKTNKNSLSTCGLKQKECNGMGISTAGETLEKCKKCPIYKKTKKK